MTIIRSPAAQAVYDAELKRRGESDTFIRTPDAIEAWEQAQAKKYGYKLPPISTGRTLDPHYRHSQYEYWSASPDKEMDTKNRRERAKIFSAIRKGVKPENIKHINKKGYDDMGETSWDNMIPTISLIIIVFMIYMMSLQ